MHPTPWRTEFDKTVLLDSALKTFGSCLLIGVLTPEKNATTCIDITGLPVPSTALSSQAGSRLGQPTAPGDNHRRTGGIDLKVAALQARLAKLSLKGLGTARGLPQQVQARGFCLNCQILGWILQPNRRLEIDDLAAGIAPQGWGCETLLPTFRQRAPTTHRSSRHQITAGWIPIHRAQLDL